MPRHPHSSQALTTVSEEDWALAREREPIVRDLVQNPPAYGARAEAMAAAASELALTPNHLYRLLKAYEANPRTRSLLLKAPGPASGGRRLDDRVEAIIEEEIKGTYLTLLHPKKSLLMKGIHARCAAEGLTRPARQTVDTRLAAISKREQTKRRHGRKRARDEFNPIRGSLEAERALEIIQIDHTPTDLMAVEPDSLEVIGRPFITLAVDIRTRMYGGFYLTFDPPSATSVAACIAHAVMDKSEWLTSRGLPARWPVMGLCEVVHTDNGKEFHSKAFTRACEDYGIELRYRPPGTPHMGGHVERRIGHLSQELHLLPGTTFSNIKERGVYDAAGNACLTITEIEWLVASIILEHHASFHEGIGTSPNAKWAADTEGKVFRMPADLRTFHRDFLPFEERTVQRDGVHLFNISYWHDALTPFLHEKRKVTAHYNPADLSKVFIRGVSGEYLEVPYRNLRRPAISLWEHKAASRALRRQGRAGVDEAMIFDMVLARRKLVEEASGRSRRARLERARGHGRHRPCRRLPPRRSSTRRIGSCPTARTTLRSTCHSTTRRPGMTDDAYRHLGPSALEVIALSPEERIVRMQGRRFTEYPRCRFVLDLMLDQLEQPAGTIKPNLLIWGESGQGKSTIMRKHLRDHPAVFDRNSGVRRTSVVGLEMPPMCDVKWFYTQLLRAIDAPVNESRVNIPVMADRVVTLYRLTGVRQILIDESHDMLMGTLRQQRIMLTVIRHLSNMLGIPLVLFGTQDAREALMHDHQLTRRFRFVELPVWEAGEEFQTMVGSVVRTLPLRRPSTLTTRSIRALLSHCGGTTAKLFETLIDLGIDAIQVGEERITADMVNDLIGRPGMA